VVKNEPSPFIILFDGRRGVNTSDGTRISYANRVCFFARNVLTVVFFRSRSVRPTGIDCRKSYAPARVPPDTYDFRKSFDPNEYQSTDRIGPRRRTLGNVRLNGRDNPVRFYRLATRAHGVRTERFCYRNVDRWCGYDETYNLPNAQVSRGRDIRTIEGDEFWTSSEP